MTNKLTITDVCSKFNLTLRTLRYWEEKQLIAPAREGLSRLYDEAQVLRVAQIVDMKGCGLEVNEIRRLLILADRGDAEAKREMLEILETRSSALADEHAVKTRQIARIRRAIAELRPEIGEAA